MSLIDTMNGYQKEWDVYQRLERRFLLVVAAFIPVDIATLLLSVRIFGKTSPVRLIAPPVVAFIWVFWGLILRGQLLAWKCPRCHERFASSSGSSKRCVHCNLPRYAEQ